MLRWGSSIHNFRRTATRDTELRGVPIAEGDKVVIYYASANRDEEVFDDPHTFDVGRTPNDHVTFGGGGRALLPRRQPGPGRDQGDDAPARRAPARHRAGRARRTACTPTSSTASRRCPSASPPPPPVLRRTAMRTPICDELGIEFPIFAFTHCRDVVGRRVQGRRLRRARRRRLQPRAARDRAGLDRRARRRRPLRRRHRHPRQVRGHGRTWTPTTWPRSCARWSPRATSTSPRSSWPTGACPSCPRRRATPCASWVGPRPRPRRRSTWPSPIPR